MTGQTTSTSSPPLPPRSLHYLEISLGISAVFMSCIEEQEYRLQWWATDAHDPLYLSVDGQETPPQSFRVLCMVLLGTLVAPHGAEWVVSLYSQHLISLVLIAIAVAYGEFACSRNTRILQGIFVYFILWLVVYATRKYGLESILAPSRFYVGCILYAATIRECSPTSNEFLIDGCFHCNAVSAVVASVFAAATLVPCALEQIGMTSTYVRHLCYLLQLATMIITLLRSGILIVDNPTFMPLRSACREGGSCPTFHHEWIDGPSARRNAFVSSYPATRIMTLISSTVGVVDHLEEIDSTLASWFASAVPLCYVWLRLENAGSTYPPHYILSDISFVAFFGVVVAFTSRLFTRDVTSVGLQCCILLELIATVLDYGVENIITYFTMFCNMVLIVALLLTLGLRRSHPKIAEAALLAGQATSLWLLLAYAAGFSLIEDFRPELIMNVHLKMDVEQGNESGELFLAGMYAGVRAFMLHFAPVTVFVPLRLERGLSFCNRCVVWFAFVLLVCLSYVFILMGMNTGMPQSYPISFDVLLVTIAAVVVCVPFVCAV